MRLALVTEGMIHRTLDDLMDWLDEHVPEVRDLEVGTGGYSPLGHSPLELGPAERRAWHARLVDRGYRVAAFNVSGNPLHPDEAIAARHDADLRRTIELAIDLGVDRIVAMSGCPAAGPGTGTVPHSRPTPGSLTMLASRPGSGKIGSGRTGRPSTRSWLPPIHAS